MNKIDELEALLNRIEAGHNGSLHGHVQWHEDKAEFYQQINKIGPQLLAVVRAIDLNDLDPLHGSTERIKQALTALGASRDD